MKVLFFLYQWLFATPLFLLLTILVALSTMILSPILPDCNLSYFPARFWGRAFCALHFIKVKKSGFENIDLTQSCIITANHQSIIDIFVIYGWLPVFFKWVMKEELRKIPFIGWACDAAGHIFMDRKNPIAAKRSIEKAEKRLVNGVSVVIFPEGTRSYDGKLGKFKKGAFRIAVDLQLPVLPVSLKGFYERMPRKTFNVTPGTVEIIVHQAIDVKNYADDMPRLMDDTFKIMKN